MSLNQEAQLSAGHIISKFLLQDDIDSAALYLASLDSKADQLTCIWAALAVQSGAIRSLAEMAQVDAVQILTNIISKRARGDMA
jgi:ribosome-binding factor A